MCEDSGITDTLETLGGGRGLQQGLPMAALTDLPAGLKLGDSPACASQGLAVVVWATTMPVKSLVYKK